MRRLNRRQALGLVGGAALAPLVVARNVSAARAELPDPPLAAMRRPEPGLLEVTLDARRTRLDVAGATRALWTYSGQFPGPVIRARSGDRVRLSFTNRLPEPTNLHYHGLHVSPAGRADNVWLSIAPGETFDYAFTIPEGEHGTFWYHPHFHGRIARQMWMGLSGPLIVEGPTDAIPEIAAAEERIAVIRDIAFAGEAPTPHTPKEWIRGKEGDVLLVNGTVGLPLRARKSLLRLRLINASNARYLNIGFADGAAVTVIARDGHTLPRPQTVETLLLVPAARADILVAFTDREAKALVHRYFHRGGTLDPWDRPILTLLPPERIEPVAIPETLIEPPAYGPADATGRRRIMMGMYYFNSLPFNPARTDIAARLGEVEVWEVVNAGTMDHPFHAHTWYFRLLARNGVAEPLRPWLDMVNLRPGDRVELLVPFRTFTGRTVFHCHIAEHGDKGMMGTMEVGA